MERDPRAPVPMAATTGSPLNHRAVVLFVVILTMLTGIGLASWLYRPTPPRGLPSDLAVAHARAALDSIGGTLDLAIGDLRFASSFGEAGTSSAPIDPERTRALTTAAFQLEKGRAQHRFDPRYDCLIGHLELAADRWERAERRYRAALSLSPGYGEAHLGLGVALALRAASEGEPSAARSRRLEALGQLAAVDESDPFYRVALYDRVLILLEVQRTDEARRLAKRYAELEPESVWTAALRRRIDRGNEP